MTSTVTSARVREIIAAYGAAPHRWPEIERAAALARVAADATLAAELAAARALDALLDAQPAPPEIRINPAAIAVAARRGTPGGSLPRSAPLRWRMAGMAAAAILGFVVGIAGLAPLHAPVERDDASGFAAQVEEDAL